MNLTKNITRLLSKGTAVVSFNYGAKARNVIIGANIAHTRNVPWGRKLNRALIFHKGEYYLFGRVMNDRVSKVKCFKVSEIYNPSSGLCKE